MKKIYVSILILATVLFALMLSSCACKHEYGEWKETKAPTCADYGSSERVCSKCGETDKKLLSPNDLHVFGEWETQTSPSCIEIGEEKRTCTVCGDTESKGLPIDIEAHSFGEWVETKAPTCSKLGLRERVCTLCEKKETATVPKPEEGGHSFGDWKISIEPTCSSEGQKVRFCELCEKPEYEVLTPLDEGGHSYGEWYTVTAPTCVDTGVKMRDCVYCESKEEGTIEIDEDAHSFGDWVVSIEPTCSTVGEKKRQCALCQIYDVGEIDPLDEGGHAFGQWQTTIKPTCESTGEEARECALCGEIETNVLEKLPIVYTITLDIDGTKTVVNLPEDGIYSLTAPTKLGYTFIGWFDGENEFLSSGIVTESKEIWAKFDVAPTVTFNELKTRLEGGVDRLLLASDIEITETIYVLGNTEIYTSGDYTLTRSAGFLGDIFVLGEDENGRNTILSGKFPSLTIKPSNGTVTIDGNRENVNGTVHGTVFFMLNGTTVNLYDGTVIKNCQKLANERALDPKYALGENTLIGGSVAIIDDGIFNMYGGEISDNSVNLKYCSQTPEEERVEGYRDSSYGGAIYSIGAVNIYGGTIKNNEASYGGAVFTSRTFNIEGGIFDGNSATSYGGALFGTNNGSGIHYIGSPNGDKKEINVIFRGNTAKGGGAIYQQYNNATVIYGNTLFEENKALGKMGGAIFTGGELVINYAEFKNNIAADRGGALYGTYTEAEKDVRVIDIKEAIFEGNSAARGGAIAASATTDAEDTGAIFELGNVTFINNLAFKTESSTPTFIDNVDREGAVRNYNGNGGVAHFTAKCEIHFYGDVVLKNNVSQSKGGALYLTNQAKLKSLDSSSLLFEGNEGKGYGGAIYLTNGSSATLANVRFIENRGNRGGAIALLSSGDVTLSGLIADKNVSADSGGFLYAELSSILISSGDGEAKITNNESETSGAGAIYLEGSTLNLNGNENAGILIEGNSAGTQGGVICAYIGSRSVKLTDPISGEEITETESVRSSVRASYVTFKSNVANAKSEYGGGVIYASNTDVVIQNSIFDSNEAVYGGAVSLYSGSEFKAIDTVFTNNVAKANGGVMYTSKSNAIFENVTVNGNTALGYTKTETSTDEETGEEITTETYVKGNGGAFYFNTNSTAIFRGVSASGNTSDVGGFLMAGYSVVTVETLEGIGNTFTENKANENGGVFYISNNSSLLLNGINATKNEALNGGFAYVYEATLFDISGEGNVISENVGKSESEQYGAGAIYIYKTASSVNGVTFKNNTGNCGGAVGVRACNSVSVVFEGCTFDGNTGTGTGGTFYINTSTVTVNNSVIKGSVSGKNGGAIYSTTGTINTNNVTFENNTCGSNYGGVAYLTKTTFNSNGDTFKGNSAKHGGAVAVNSSSTFVVSGSEFIGNIASSNGGAIWVGSNLLQLTDSTVNGNTASQGGGIYVSENGSSAVISSSEISGNIASSNGGAIWYGTGVINIKDSSIKNNEATLGGGIYVSENGSSAVISNSEISGNIASSNGGAIYVSGGSLEITESAVNGNTASQGGGIYVTGASTTVIGNDIEISENVGTLDTADGYGGGIYATSGATVTITDLTLNGNKSAHGGGIGIREGASVTINGIAASGNEARGYTKDGAISSGNGGAINAGTGALTIGKGTKITSNTFTQNKANSGGGAIYMLETETTFVANEIVASENEAVGDRGGALYIRGASVTVDIGTLTMTNNVAKGYAGGAYLYAFKDGKIGTLVANGNESKSSGGAIYIAGSASLTIDEISGSGNISGANGGFAYIGSSTVTIKSGNIGENEDKNGRALHLVVSVTVYKDQFTYLDGTVNDASKIKEVEAPVA